ncbi:hypothetical protein PROP_01559 [Propionicimonas sp. T2.31MG-18]
MEAPTVVGEAAFLVARPVPPPWLRRRSSTDARCA